VVAADAGLVLELVLVVAADAGLVLVLVLVLVL
jgi:hypothetical protein